MTVASKPKPKAKTADVVEYNVTDRDDYYGDGGYFKVMVTSAALKKVAPDAPGGWKRVDARNAYNYRQKQDWYAGFSTEDACCGFPVLSGFQESKKIVPHVKEVGEKLGAYLKENCIYMAAYVPDTKAYVSTKKILAAAGFKIGLTLKRTHGGAYTNSRWEWFDGEVLKGKDEKAVPASSS